MSEFDPKYHEAEEKFRAEAARLHERNDAIKADIRGEVDLTPEEREERYIASYKGVSESFDKLANTFAGSVEQDRRDRGALRGPSNGRGGHPRR